MKASWERTRCLEDARRSAQAIMDRFGLHPGEIKIALQLGTGWGDAVTWIDEMDFADAGLIFDYGGGLSYPAPAMQNHALKIVLCKLGDQKVIALRGRIHFHQTWNLETQLVFRKQIEMLIALGVRTLILTCAAGGSNTTTDRGAVYLVRSFCTLGARPLLFLQGEGNPNHHDVLDPKLIRAVKDQAFEAAPYRVLTTRSFYVYHGPQFEDKECDKRIIHEVYGIDLVGMSLWAETMVASLHADKGVKVVPLAFVTNRAKDSLNTSEHVAEITKSQEQLAAFLPKVVEACSATVPA